MLKSRFRCQPNQQTISNRTQFQWYENIKQSSHVRTNNGEQNSRWNTCNSACCYAPTLWRNVNALKTNIIWTHSTILHIIGEKFPIECAEYIVHYYLLTHYWNGVFCRIPIETIDKHIVLCVLGRRQISSAKWVGRPAI